MSCSGSSPVSQKSSTAESTHEFCRMYAVCPSPSWVTRRLSSSWSWSRSAHSYGVAGSRVVPMTRIGAAPFAEIVCGSTTGS